MATVRMQSNAYPDGDGNADVPAVAVGSTTADGGTASGGSNNPPSNPTNPPADQGGDSGDNTNPSDNPPSDTGSTTPPPDDTSGTTNPPGDTGSNTPPPDEVVDPPPGCDAEGNCDLGNPNACGGGTGNQSTNTVASSAGNPINIVTGNKFQQETDIASLPGKLGLEFIRHYNSKSSYHGNLGYHWRHTYDVKLNRSNPKSPYIDQADGRRVMFEKRDTNNGNIVFANVYSDGWLELKKESATWHWHSGRKLNFDRDGRLNYLVAKSGQSIFLTYDNDGRLIQVNDPQDRTLGFVYYPNNRIKNIIDPNGNSLKYIYNNAGNLSSVKYSDDTSRIYHYEDSRYIHHLTGLTDGRGVRFATWAYDEKGRANLSTHANGVEKVTLKFKQGKTLVTNTSGITSTYYTNKINHVPVVTRVDGPGCSSCGGGDAVYEYNDANQLIRKKDKAGITTHFA